MRRGVISIGLLAVPALLAAQATSTSGQVEAKADAKVQAQAREAAVMAGLSAETRTRIEAMFAKAHDRDLPTELMQDRVAEGRTKGAADAQIIAETAKTLGHLEATQSALVKAGRPEPSAGEISRGAALMGRGVTTAQLEAVIGKAPADRSLAVAFEVLADLAAGGVPVDQALTQVSSRLAAGASDHQLIELKSGLGLGLTKKP